MLFSNTSQAKPRFCLELTYFIQYHIFHCSFEHGRVEVTNEQFSRVQGSHELSHTLLGHVTQLLSAATTSDATAHACHRCALLRPGALSECGPARSLRPRVESRCSEVMRLSGLVSNAAECTGRYSLKDNVVCFFHLVLSLISD